MKRENLEKENRIEKKTDNEGLWGGKKNSITVHMYAIYELNNKI